MSTITPADKGLRAAFLDSLVASMVNFKGADKEILTSDFEVIALLEAAYEAGRNAK